MEYEEFIKSKETIVKNSGFDITKDELNNKLFEYQKDVVKWALKKGKAALFEGCGLGKTIQQLEWSHQVCKYTNGNVLILAPLAVAPQTVKEGKKFGIEVTLCTNQSEVKDGINITNYEKIDRFNINEFVGIVLDESSILKSFQGKVKSQLIELFKSTPYKLSCTATPSPNDYVELGNQSEFLGIMKSSEMLAMYFTHDGGCTSKWRLKGHAQDAYWKWLASWAVVIENPKDLGYNIEGYDLPKLNVIQIIADEKEISNDILTLTERRKARKESLQQRCEKAAEIINNSNENWLVWCDLNDESKLLHDLINSSVEIKGSDKSEYKANEMLNFSENKTKVLVTKSLIAGFGMNWQNCHNMIFVGVSDSFEQYYQAVRRCWRFGQEKEVNVYLVIGSREGTVKDNLDRKAEQTEKMQKIMVEYTKEITSKEIRCTYRNVTEYNPTITMILPKWEEMRA
nr:MAG TPA: Helicase of the snf2 rad54 family [Caudoviricetes sp.]